MLVKRISFISALILSTLFLLPIALAQEIDLFGYRVSFLLIAPIILIIVFLIFFSIIVLRDFLKDKNKPIKEETDSEIKEDIPKTLERKKGPKIIEEKKAPTMLYLSELDKLKKDLNSLPTHDSYDRLMKIIRTFFSELLQIPSGFTFDELELELKKKHKKIVFFSKNLSEICYNSESISKEQLKGILAEFEKIINKIIGPENLDVPKQTNFKNSLDQLLHKTKILKPNKYRQKIGDIEELEIEEKLIKESRKKKEHEKELSRKDKLMDEEAEIEEKLESLKRKEEQLDASSKPKRRSINQLLKEGNTALKNNLDKAFDIYEQIYLIYNDMPKSKKKKINPKITKFYNKIKRKMSKS